MILWNEIDIIIIMEYNDEDDNNNMKYKIKCKESGRFCANYILIRPWQKKVVF